MASATSIDELLENPMFLELTKALFGAATLKQASGNRVLDANLALDALSFLSAMIQEAHPDYATEDSLGEATKNLAADHLAFLHFLRDHSRETGKHMLDGMTDEKPVSPSASDADDSDLGQLVHEIQSAIIRASHPRNVIVNALGQTGTLMRYDLATVAQALIFVLASIAAQSGDITTLRARRQFADTLRDNFVTTFRDVEEQLARVSKAAPGNGTIN